jgi:hypothetical protein
MKQREKEKQRNLLYGHHCLLSATLPEFLTSCLKILAKQAQLSNIMPNRPIVTRAIGKKITGPKFVNASGYFSDS